MVFRHHHDPGGLGTGTFNGGLHRLDTERSQRRVEIVKARREQVGVHRGELVAGVAQIDRTVEWSRGFKPMGAEPLLDTGLVLE